MNCTCIICGGTFTHRGTGMPRKTCSYACKQEHLRRYHREYKRKVRAENTPYAQRQRAYALRPEIVERERERSRERSRALSPLRRAETKAKRMSFWSNLRAEGFVGLSEAAARIGISPDTLRRQTTLCAIAYERRGRYVVFRIDEVERYIREQRGATGRESVMYGVLAAQRRAGRAALIAAWNVPAAAD